MSTRFKSRKFQIAQIKRIRILLVLSKFQYKCIDILSLLFNYAHLCIEPHLHINIYIYKPYEVIKLNAPKAYNCIQLSQADA